MYVKGPCPTNAMSSKMKKILAYFGIFHYETRMYLYLYVVVPSLEMFET